MMALEEDLIGFAATNTSPLMAPFGGYTPMLGFKSICHSNTCWGRFLLYDMATSLVAKKVR